MIFFEFLLARITHLRSSSLGGDAVAWHPGHIGVKTASCRRDRRKETRLAMAACRDSERYACGSKWNIRTCQSRAPKQIPWPSYTPFNPIRQACEPNDESRTKKKSRGSRAYTKINTNSTFSTASARISYSYCQPHSKSSFTYFPSGMRKKLWSLDLFPLRWLYLLWLNFLLHWPIIFNTGFWIGKRTVWCSVEVSELSGRDSDIPAWGRLNILGEHVKRNSTFLSFSFYSL